MNIEVHSTIDIKFQYEKEKNIFTMMMVFFLASQSGEAWSCGKNN